MNDLNDCKFTGRLGKDPESRSMPGGGTVVNFSIAVGSSWKDKNSGEKREQTEWVRCVAFGGLAGICAKYLAKGSFVLVGGRMQTRKWQGQDGKDNYTTEINLNHMQMLGGKQEPKREESHQQSYPDTVDDGDCPF